MKKRWRPKEYMFKFFAENFSFLVCLIEPKTLHTRGHSSLQFCLTKIYLKENTKNGAFAKWPENLTVDDKKKINEKESDPHPVG